MVKNEAAAGGKKGGGGGGRVRRRILANMFKAAVSVACLLAYIKFRSVMIELAAATATATATAKKTE